MELSHVDLAGAAGADGVVVVVDTLRAFTTAAAAFAAGAARIIATGSVAEARAVRTATPGALLMGEVDGHPVDGFDFDNSPTAMDVRDLTGRTLVQRTTAGTQGLIRSTGTEALFAASFVCAEATVRAVVALAPSRVTFVLTGWDHRDGEEDRAAADWIGARLRGERPDPAPYLARVAASDAGRTFADPSQPVFTPEDLARCAELDRYDLAMRATPDGAGRPVLRAV